MAKRAMRKSTGKAKSKGTSTRKKAGRKRAAKKVARKKARKAATKTAKKATKPRRQATTPRRKQRPQQAPGAIETTVVDLVEERLPGVVTITEFEETSIAVPKNTIKRIKLSSSTAAQRGTSEASNILCGALKSFPGPCHSSEKELVRRTELVTLRILGTFFPSALCRCPEAE